MAAVNQDDRFFSEDAVEPTGTPKEEFEAWWVAGYPKLIANARWLTRSRERARDLVQDLAVLALQRIERTQFGSQDDFLRWAHKRLRWIFLDQIRATRTRGLTRRVEREVLEAVQPAQETEAAFDSLFAGIHELPPRQREIIRRTMVGHSTKEIAKALKIEESSVRSSLRYARARLEVHLQNNSRSTG